MNVVTAAILCCFKALVCAFKQLYIIYFNSRIMAMAIWEMSIAVDALYKNNRMNYVFNCECHLCRNV